MTRGTSLTLRTSNLDSDDPMDSFLPPFQSLGLRYGPAGQTTLPYTLFFSVSPLSSRAHSARHRSFFRKWALCREISRRTRPSGHPFDVIRTTGVCRVSADLIVTAAEMNRKAPMPPPPGALESHSFTRSPSHLPSSSFPIEYTLSPLHDLSLTSASCLQFPLVLHLVSISLTLLFLGLQCTIEPPKGQTPDPQLPIHIPLPFTELSRLFGGRLH